MIHFQLALKSSFTQLIERLKTQFTVMRKAKQSNSGNSMHYDKTIGDYYAIA